MVYFFERHRTSIVIIIMLLLGFVVRIQFFSFSSMIPINDGGLFITMTNDLIDNGFKIPKFTTYNNQSIPYAYPALSFYVIGFLNQVTNLDLLIILKYLPLLYNLLSIPAFYFLSKEFTNDENQALIASLIFTISKPSYEWFIMGGGITRAPAYTFSIIAIFFFIRGIKKDNILNIILSGCFLGLTSMHHLEKAQFAFIAFSLISIFLKKNPKSIKYFLTSSIISLICFLPLLIPVLKFHGVDPYVNAFSSGEFSFPLSVLKLIFFNFYSTSPFLDIVGVITLIGFVTLLIKNEPKNNLLPIWLVTICFLNPRSVDKFAIIPTSIIFSYGINVLMFGINNYLKPKNYHFEIRNPAIRRSVFLFSLIIILSLVLASRINSLGNSTISDDDIQAMIWIKNNTPTSASFIVIPSSFWAGDLIGEWFPTFTQRRNVLCVQGAEWAGNFNTLKIKHNKFNLYLENNGLDYTIKKFHQDSDHIYCSENQFKSHITNCPEKINDYTTIYNNDNKSVFIYKKN